MWMESSAESSTNNVKCAASATSAIACDGPTIAGNGIAQNSRTGTFNAELMIQPVIGNAISIAYSKT
jgi:hypothetical protein